MRRFIHSTYKSISERVTAPLSESQFREKGVLTPEEFVQAGDFLVQTCPTWAWEAGDPQKQKYFLPDTKQYLITRNVPCLQRASAVESYATEVPSGQTGEDVEGGEWVATAAGDTEEDFEKLPATSHPEHVRDIDEDGEDRAPQSSSSPDEPTAILDISDLDLNAEPDVAVAPQPVQPTAPAAAGVLQTRTYDVLISYDKHYQVPRVWLVGYGEDRTPLTQEQVMEDVISDYYTHRARNTVSVEGHPHKISGGQVVSIHPCRHAEVMRKLTGVVAGDSGEFPVEHYMVLFLKFISSVVPTIEYDFTMPSGM